ncbi:MAG: TolC family protein [Limisphaerales bacterium]
MNNLELQALQANQSLKAAVARVDQARATARVARGDLLPSLNLDPSFNRQRYSPNQAPAYGPLTANTWQAPLDLSYEIDLWGRVRRGFESARADAQGSLAAFDKCVADTPGRRRAKLLQAPRAGCRDRHRERHG